MATSTTAEPSVHRLSALGATVQREAHEPRGLTGIGAARRAALALALHTGSASHVLYSDLDHVLRWAGHRPDALAATLAEVGRRDFTVVGRLPAVRAALPATLRDTESIVNRVFAAVTGRQWDLLSGVRGMSRAAAALLVERCREDSIANDVTWPLLALDAGLDTGYVEAPGLDYEDDAQFTAPRRREEWLRDLEGSPRAWLVRLEIARLQVEAIERHGAAAPG